MAHGGKGCEGETVRVSQWFLWSHSQLRYHSARSFCGDVGGQLFDDLDGTLAQLQLLADKLRYDTFWLGISDYGHEGKWKSLDGQDMADRLYWKSQEPNGALKENVVAVMGQVIRGGDKKAFVDEYYANEHPFACQML